MANALSGESGPAKCGWELGSRELTFNDDFKKMFPNVKCPLNVIQVHRDQVL